MKLGKKCPKCNTTLATLYYREYGEKNKWIKIKALYCRTCEKPIRVDKNRNEK